jgi:hypothetical protein
LEHCDVEEGYTLMAKDRCFLFLVNYARAKPEVALKALPILLRV